MFRLCAPGNCNHPAGRGPTAIRGRHGQYDMMRQYSADEIVRLNSSPLSLRRTKCHSSSAPRPERQPAARAAARRPTAGTLPYIPRALRHPWSSAQRLEPSQCAVPGHYARRTGAGEAEHGCREEAIVRPPPADLHCPRLPTLPQSEPVGSVHKH